MTKIWHIGLYLQALRALGPGPGTLGPWDRDLGPMGPGPWDHGTGTLGPGPGIGDSGGALELCRIWSWIMALVAVTGHVNSIQSSLLSSHGSILGLCYLGDERKIICCVEFML